MWETSGSQQEDTCSPTGRNTSTTWLHSHRLYPISMICLYSSAPNQHIQQVKHGKKLSAQFIFKLNKSQNVVLGFRGCSVCACKWAALLRKIYTSTCVEAWNSLQISWVFDKEGVPVTRSLFLQQTLLTHFTSVKKLFLHVTDVTAFGRSAV